MVRRKGFVSAKQRKKVMGILGGMSRYYQKEKRKMAQQYEEELLEPGLRPEYVEKAKEIMKQKAIAVGSVNELRKRYE